MVDPLNHLPTRRAVLAERAMLSALGGGCQVPMGAVSRVAGEVLTLRGAVVRPDGSERIEAEGSGPAADPEGIGRRVAEELLARVRGACFRLLASCFRLRRGDGSRCVAVSSSSFALRAGSTNPLSRMTARLPMDISSATTEAAAGAAKERNYVFRGDDNYRGGPVGRAMAAEADAADIQNVADHVLRKESSRSSRYTSFTEEVKVARKFTSAPDNRCVSKADLAALRELEVQGVIRIWDPDQGYAALRAGSKRLAKQAADVRAAMRRNSEILIEGQIPAGILERTN